MSERSDEEACGGRCDARDGKERVTTVEKALDMRGSPLRRVATESLSHRVVDDDLKEIRKRQISLDIDKTVLIRG